MHSGSRGWSRDNPRLAGGPGLLCPLAFDSTDRQHPLSDTGPCCWNTHTRLHPACRQPPGPGPLPHPSLWLQEDGRTQRPCLPLLPPLLI